MSIEFISAKDLPTTEAEEVDVLCVEGGELKRKAGASLGGGAGGYIWKLTEEDYTVDTDNKVITITANYDEALKVLEAGGNVAVPYTENGMTAYCNTVAWGYFPVEMTGSSAFLVLYIFNASITDNIPNMYICMCANGTYIPNLE